MWHMTGGTWHVTHNTRHLTFDRLWTLGQNFRSLALTDWEIGCFEDLKEKDDQLNEWINEWVTKLFVEQPRLHRICWILSCISLRLILFSFSSFLNPGPSQCMPLLPIRKIWWKWGFMSLLAKIILAHLELGFLGNLGYPLVCQNKCLNDFLQNKNYCTQQIYWFSPNWPSGQFGHRVVMSFCLSVVLSPCKTPTSRSPKNF